MLKKSLILAVMTGVVLLLSCSRKAHTLPDPEEDEPTLGLTVDFPALTGTKADAVLPASDEENKVHSLSVWVFTHEEPHTLVAEKEISAEDLPPEGGVRRYSLPVSTDFAETHPNVDVFILANAASIDVNYKAGITDTESEEYASYDKLATLSFGRTFDDEYNTTSDYFGITNVVRNVGEYGLPMSGFGENLVVQGQAPIFKLDVIRVQRDVSKMRFVFCKTMEGGDMAIQSVMLGGSLIPLQEKVFTSGLTGVLKNHDWDLDNYDPGTYTWLWPKDDGDNPVPLCTNPAPEDYIYINQSPLEYQQLIDDAVAQNLLTDLGYTYFRETDRQITGYINYSVNGDNKYREFRMNKAGDFARNHTWTLLGYFLSGRNLQLAVTVMPWDYNTYTVDFTKQSVVVDKKFTVDGASTATVTVTSQKPAKGYIRILAPIGGRLYIKPVGDVEAFDVSPEIADIQPDVNNGYIYITISRKPGWINADPNDKKKITLSFSVEVGEAFTNIKDDAIDTEYTFVI